MATLSRFNKIALLGLGAVGGGLAYYQIGKTDKQFDVHNSWTTNYTPSIKWDKNWDHREPESIVRPKRSDKPEDENKYNEQIEKAKSKAVRHLFLIRHGQYNTDGATDKERILSDLGRQQADFTGKRLASLDIQWDLLVRSTMTRAQETASIIAKHLPKDIEVKDCQLLEEGAPIPPEPPVGHWRPEPKQFFQDSARIEAAFRRYFYRAPPEQTKDTYTLLVCHANVIRFFVCKALQFPPEGWLRISLSHGSITWISILPSGNVVLRSLSETGHMEPKFITSRLLLSEFARLVSNPFGVLIHGGISKTIPNGFETSRANSDSNNEFREREIIMYKLMKTSIEYSLMAENNNQSRLKPMMDWFL